LLKVYSWVSITSSCSESHRRLYFRSFNACTQNFHREIKFMWEKKDKKLFTRISWVTIFLSFWIEHTRNVEILPEVGSKFIKHSRSSLTILTKHIWMFYNFLCWPWCWHFVVAAALLSKCSCIQSWDISASSFLNVSAIFSKLLLLFWF
jgi:hypothetical protein